MADSLAGKKLILIDAMSLVFRAFYAPMQAALVSSSGIPTKAVYIFVRTLRKIIREHSPDYMGVAFDLAEPTFRDNLFVEYKSNRPAFPEELSVQLPYVRRFCQALGLAIVEKGGFEADDLIGTLAREGASEGEEVLIVSGDEDLFQLVDNRVRVLKPSRGSADKETLCDEAKVEEVLGVEPSQVVDWLALTGDPSDNIPGARPLPGQEPPVGPGGKKRSFIGPKGATELIKRFGSLEKVLANYEQVERQSYREALRDFANEARLSKQIAAIRTDVPLDLSVRDLKPALADRVELMSLCRELGFSSMLRELLEEAPQTNVTSLESVDISGKAEFKNWLESIERSALVAVSPLFEGPPDFSGRLLGLSFSDGKRLANGSQERYPGLFQSLRSYLSDKSRRKAVHNSKLLRLLLGKEQIELAGVTDDTMLYSYLLDPLASSHEIEDVVPRRFGRTVSSASSEATEFTRQLAPMLATEVEREHLKPLYEEIELPLAEVLADVERTGVHIDPEILARMSVEFAEELTGLTHEIYNLAGEAFDIDSPKQLGEILFGKLKLPGGRKLKKSGQYSTQASVLESLAEQYELPRKIIEYRTRTKLKSTYVDALPKYINPQTGRLHTSFNQTVARTGRLSSSNPNLQNIPVGDEYGLRIRSAFVADSGWQLISADYSQIELRVLAHMSEDPLLIEAFSRNEDIHSRTAREIFGVPPELQTHEHRRMAKAINYGVIYGLSSFGLAARTGTSKTEAKQYIDAYFERYSKVKDFLDNRLEEARASGRVRTLFGRLRPIPEIKSQDTVTRNRAEREAMNTPLQGTAADLLKLAMVKVHSRLREKRLQTRMILTVHDELVFESPEAEMSEAQAVIRTEMEGVYSFRVPLRVGIGVGKNWKEAK